MSIIILKMRCRSEEEASSAEEQLASNKSDTITIERRLSNRPLFLFYRVVIWLRKPIYC